MSSIFKGDGIVELPKDTGLDFNGGEEVGFDPAAGTDGQVVAGAGAGIIGRVIRPTDANDDYVHVLLPEHGRRLENYPLAAAVAVDTPIDLGGYFGIAMAAGDVGDRISIAM